MSQLLIKRRGKGMKFTEFKHSFLIEHIGQPFVILHKKIINEQEILNEVQWILQDVHGFTVTLANPEDDRQTTRLNLAGKKIDTTGEGGMLTITDDLSPAEKALALQPWLDAKIDVNVSSLR